MSLEAENAALKQQLADAEWLLKTMIGDTEQVWEFEDKRVQLVCSGKVSLAANVELMRAAHAEVMRRNKLTGKNVKLHVRLRNASDRIENA